MEKSNKTGAQIYGYTICLVSVITFLISVTTLVNAIIDLGDPIQAGWTQPGSPSLASFENYKMDLLKASKQGDDKATYLPNDSTFRAMYLAAKDDKIKSIQHQSYRYMMIDSFLIVICLLLFITHWIWMKKLRA